MPAMVGDGPVSGGGGLQNVVPSIIDRLQRPMYVVVEREARVT